MVDSLHSAQPPPRFGSFRPKPAASPPWVRVEQPAKQHRSRSHNIQHHEPRCGSRSASDQDVNVAESSGGVFFIDRKGDVGNQTYGANNKSAIPLYWPTSPRRTLGEEVGAHGSKNRAERPLSVLSRVDRNKLKHDGDFVGAVLHARADAYSGLSANFMPLKPERKRKRVAILGEPATPTRYPEQLIGPPAESDNEDLSADDSSSSSMADASNAVLNMISNMKVENARLSSQVKAEPWNVQAWLDYIQYQDIWIEQGLDGINANLGIENRSVAEVKLSMYMKASNTVGRDNRGRQELLIEMMHEAESVLESAKLASKWQEIAEENRHFRSLWLRYLDFGQSNFSIFGFERCRDRYAECIQLQEPEQNSAGFRTYVFLRCTTFFSESGYEELAIALWQAALEYNCFRPSSQTAEPAGSLSNRVSRFEEFWDSEHTRIGEHGVLGRSDTGVTALSQDGVIDSSSDLSKTPINDKTARWLRDEVLVMDSNTMPGRAMDETAGEDPYHVVLFSDMVPFLIDVPVDLHPTTLVNAFLCYFTLPALRTEGDVDQTSKFWQDAFLRNNFDGSAKLAYPAQTGNVNQESCERILSHLMNNHQTTLDTLFGPISTDQSPFSSFENNGVKRSFVSTVLRALVDRYPQWNALAEYYLAFEMRTNSPSAAKKIAKTLLKARPSNLRLYNAYALIEARMNHNEAADRVLSTAIGMSAALGSGDREDVILLWRSWIWEALLAGHNNIALERLLTLGRQNSLPLDDKIELAVDNSEEVFQTQEHLTTGIHATLALSHYHNTVYNMELLSLLQYLLSPTSSSLTAALSSYVVHISLLSTHTSTESKSPALELLHQSRAHLVAYHIYRNHPYRPADIRDALTESIALFPTNSKFLTLYAENEQRFRIDDRVRQIIREVLQPRSLPVSFDSIEDGKDWTGGGRHGNDNVITHAFTIWTELRRGVAAGSTTHAVRAAFERGIDSCWCRSSAAIWTAWVAYECSLLSSNDSDAVLVDRSGGDGENKLQLQRRRTKDVFYRGLRHLPWVKRYAMLAISLLRPQGVLSDEECRGVYDVLIEKGIRVYCDLDGAA